MTENSNACFSEEAKKLFKNRQNIQLRLIRDYAVSKFYLFAEDLFNILHVVLNSWIKKGYSDQ
jgi:hypothetical protein